MLLYRAAHTVRIRDDKGKRESWEDGREEDKQNALVKDQETLQNLEVKLARHSPAELIVKLAIRERLDSLETLVRQRRALVADVLRRRVVRHRKVDVEKTNLYARQHMIWERKKRKECVQARDTPG